MRQPLAPEWLRVRDAADYSGISQTELFRLCMDGAIQSVHKLKPGQAKGIRLHSPFRDYSQASQLGNVVSVA